MPKPLQGADNWAYATGSDTSASRPRDTIERVIERRVPSPISPTAFSAPSLPPAPSFRPPRELSAPPAAPAGEAGISFGLVSGSPAYLFAANRTLSGSALKVLLAVWEAGEGATILRNDFKRLTGLSGNHAILNAVQECVDNEWLLRRYQCRWCGSSVESSYDTIRLTECRACGRKMTPEAVFYLQVPEEVSLEYRGVLNQHTGMFLEHTPVPNEHAGVSNQHTGSVPSEHGSVLIRHTPTQGSRKEGRVPNQHTMTDRMDTLGDTDERQQTASSLVAKVEGVLKKHTGVSLQHTSSVPNEQTGVPIKHTPRTRADSESLARIRDSDSRIPPQSGCAETGRVVYASGEWQQVTEKLAKDSARRIGDKSVGFHVKVWAYARKLDWEKGGRRFEEGLFAIAQELEGKHNGTGKSQGALWTKMVRRYFEEKGSPLLTEAEAEEWKELHGSYAPPTL